VILDKFSGEYSRSTEEEVAGCIGKAIAAVQPTVRLVPAEEFRRVAFPALTPLEIPHGGQQWIEQAADAAFRARIASLDLRYLIIVEGSTNQDWQFQTAGSFSKYTAGAAWLTGERASSYSATIVDVKRRSEVGRVDVRARGRSTIVILPLPVPIISPTEARACNDLGERVANFLFGENLPLETAGEQSGGETAKPPAQEKGPQ
jgi:hypothetical protein